MDVNEIADAIRSLINTSPRSPTKDQLVGLLNARLLTQTPAENEAFMIHECNERRAKVHHSTGPSGQLVEGAPAYIGHGAQNSFLPMPSTLSSIGNWCYDEYCCHHCGCIVSRTRAMNSYIDWMKERYGLPSQHKWMVP